MRWIAAALVTAVLLSMACKMDYDIEEVATPEYLGTDLHDEHDECDDAEHPDHEHEHEADSAATVLLHDESDDHDVLEITGSDRHVHDAGERNHGTGWFFNQPWAATFIWGKMLRDIVILLVLSAAVLFVSGHRRKRR